MSKIDDLIQELCPDGVEYKPLKDLCSKIIVPMRDRPKVFDGPIPWCRIEDMEGHYFHKSLSGLGVSQKVIEEMNLKVFPTGTVICSCSASIGSYAINTQPLITNQTFIGLVCSGQILNTFLRYYMETQTARLLTLATTGTIPYISRKKFEQLIVPVPPMAVQQEIVRVLDSFAELEAELERRKAQYAYYRDKLLTSPLNLKLIKLGDICDLSNGDRGKSYPKQSEILEAGVPFVNAGDLINGKVNVLDCKKISKSKYDSMGGAKLKKGDILYCLRGSTGKNAIFTCDEGTVASSLVSIRPHEGFSNRYIFYLLNSSMELVQRNAKDTGAAQPNLSAASVKEYVFPVPPLEEQQRIVDILDKFDALVNDISQGLPAEIEARRKQYEYYRDKLLTFKKKEN